MAKKPAWTVGEVLAFPCDHGGWGAGAVCDARPCLTDLRGVRVPW